MFVRKIAEVAVEGGRREEEEIPTSTDSKIAVRCNSICGGSGVDRDSCMGYDPALGFLLQEGKDGECE